MDLDDQISIEEYSTDDNDILTKEIDFNERSFEERLEDYQEFDDGDLD